MDWALVSLLVSAAILLDVATTPYLFMHVYNMLVPRAFGLRHMKYDASFILWWALRAISDSPLTIQWIHSHRLHQKVHAMLEQR